VDEKELDRLKMQILKLRQEFERNKEIVEQIIKISTTKYNSIDQQHQREYVQMMSNLNSLASNLSDFLSSLPPLQPITTGKDYTKLFTQILVRKYQESIRNLQFYDILSVVQDLLSSKKEMLSHIDDELVLERAFVTQIDIILGFFGGSTIGGEILEYVESVFAKIEEFERKIVQLEQQSDKYSKIMQDEDIKNVQFSDRQKQRVLFDKNSKQILRNMKFDLMKEMSYHITNAIEECKAVKLKLEDKRKELIYEQVKIQEEIDEQKKITDEISKEYLVKRKHSMLNDDGNGQQTKKRHQ